MFILNQCEGLGIMRTTLNLHDDAFQAASDYAAARAIKLGDAVSELVKRGLGQAKQSNVSMKKKHGIWVFETSAGSGHPVVTDALVKELMEE